jgi:protein-disulfide reductase (glutathione)
VTGRRPQPAAALARGIVLAVIGSTAMSCIEVEGPPSERSAASAGTKSSPTAPPAATATAPSHGFNDEIAWRKLDEGLSAMQGGAPMMLVVHASWCERCKELKTTFASEDLAELSKSFVMVNVDQDEVPRALAYAPDGSYIPRVLFFDPDTQAVDPAIQNPRRQRHLYYYGPNDDLVASMRRALERHERT